MQRKNIKKIFILLIITAIIIFFWKYNLGQYLDLDYLKESRQKFQELYNQNTFFIISIYMLIYIVVAAFSFPGAAVLTIAGGALFGFTIGTIAVSFASTIGATLACFVSRFLLGNWVQNKFSDKLKTINSGLDKEGSFYLFTLRLIPIFPFFVINLVMGLTKFSLGKFYLVSQIGMLPGTMVYVNAGKEVAKIKSMGDILSPTLLVSFAILGLFPLLIKKIMNFVKPKLKK